MFASVSVASRSMSEKKVMWAFAVTEKTKKFASLQVGNPVVGELVAAYTAIKAFPGSYDILIRTINKKVAHAINNPIKGAKNPVLAKLYELIENRPGAVRAMVVSPMQMSPIDKLAAKMIVELTGFNKNPASNAGRTMSPVVKQRLQPRKEIKVKVTTKKRPERLTTGLEDWDDNGVSVAPSISKVEPQGDLVTCGACNAPISPLTNECLCSD